MQKKAIITSLIVLASLGCIAIWFFFTFMSHEVLESFGIMDEKFSEAKGSLDDKIETSKKEISEKDFKRLYRVALDVEAASNRLYNCIEDLKKDMLAEQNMAAEAMDYSQMDKPSQLLFENNSKRGKAIVYEIERYKKELITKLKNFSYHTFNDSVNSLFNTNRIDGKDWLEYEFDDFPIIASYTKLTAIQSDIKNTKLLAFNLLLSE